MKFFLMAKANIRLTKVMKSSLLLLSLLETVGEGSGSKTFDLIYIVAIATIVTTVFANTVYLEFSV